MAINDLTADLVDPQPHTLTKRKTALFIVLVALGWASDNFDRKVLPVALPYIGHDFNVGAAALGALSSIFFAFYAISQVPGGALADRFGSKWLMISSMFAWSVFTGLMGLGSTFWMLMLFQAAFGIGQGAWPGASMKFVSEIAPARRRMTIYGVIQFTTAVGSAAAPIAAAVAITWLGWRGMFALYMVIGVVLGVVMWILIPKSTAGLAGGSEREVRTTPRSAVRRVLHSSVLWKCAVMFVGLDLVMNGVTAWAPTYLIKAHHVSLIHTGVLASLPGYFSAVAMFIGGVLFDRWFHGRHRWIMVPCMIVTTVLLVVMTACNSVGLFITFYSAAMFAAYLTFQTVAGLPMRYCDVEIRGAATAFVNVGGAVGGFIAPLLVGFLIQEYTYRVGFLVLTVGAVIAAVASLLCPQSPERLTVGMNGRPVAHQQ
ncbi:MFS transporter [Tsukamurella soli]|uniref:MFS transporter n=1 Tax=Tsukamurella soli TaxID=644556 RepID=A0ABP8JER6_9ACTN